MNTIHFTLGQQVWVQRTGGSWDNDWAITRLGREGGRHRVEKHLHPHMVQLEHGGLMHKWVTTEQLAKWDTVHPDEPSPVDIRDNPVQCKTCGRVFVCTWLDDYYNDGKLDSNTDGECERCLMRNHEKAQTLVEYMVVICITTLLAAGLLVWMTPDTPGYCVAVDIRENTVYWQRGKTHEEAGYADRGSRLDYDRDVPDAVVDMVEDMVGTGHGKHRMHIACE